MTDPTSSPEDTPKSVSAAAETIAAGAGVAIGAAAGGPAGAALGAIIGAAVTPYVMSISQASWQEITVRRQVSVTRVIGESAEQLDLDPQELVDKAFSTQNGTELLADALHAAAATINQRKVSALARAVANGLADDQARIDQERLVIRALNDLEEPHLALLTRLGKGAVSDEYGTLLYARDYSAGDINAWCGDGHVDTVLTATASVILRTLDRNGLIEENLDEQAESRRRQSEEHLTAQLRKAEEARRQAVTPTNLFSVRSARANVKRVWRVTQFGTRVVSHLSRVAPSSSANPDSDTVSDDGAE